jgi:hypothetical protein
MSGLVRNTSTARRWRTALRAGLVAASLAVVAGVPLAAQAHDWDRGGRGREWGEHRAWREHVWREHHRPYWGGGYGYYGPRYYGYGYAPSYGYYAPGYYAPGASLSFNFR